MRDGANDDLDALALHWAGPAVEFEGRLWGVGVDGGEVLVGWVSVEPMFKAIHRARAHETTWPPTFDEVYHFKQSYVVDPAPDEIVVRGGSLVARNGEDSFQSLTLASLGASDPRRLWGRTGFGFAIDSRDGVTIYSARVDRPPRLVVERRPERDLAIDGDELGRVPAKASTRAALCPLDEGGCLIASWSGGGGDISLLRVTPTGSLAPLRSKPKLIALGPRTILRQRTGGAWLLTGPSEGGDVHIHRLDGPDFAPQPPFVLPCKPGERLLAACTVGDQLAIATSGTDFTVHLFDGARVARSTGKIARGAARSELGCLVAMPSRRALVLGVTADDRTWIARLDILSSSDERAALPIFEEPEPRRIPAPCVLRARYLQNVRLHHFIRTISALHYEMGDEHRYVERGAEGCFESSNGCGNNHVVAWDADAIVALSFDHDYGRSSERSMFDRLPASATAAARAAKRRMHAMNGAEWIAAVGRREVHRPCSEPCNELRGYADEEDVAIDRWMELHSVSRDHAELARKLAAATASGAYRLTEEDAAVLVSEPPGKEGTEPSDAALKRVVKHLRDARVTWQVGRSASRRSATPRADDLIDAVVRGDIEAVRELARRGTNLDARSRRAVVGYPFADGGATPLAIATLARNADMVRALLAAGADAHIRPLNWSLLNLAAKAGSRVLCEIYLAAGQEAEGTFFYNALEGGDVQVLELVLERGWAERTSAHWVEKLEAIAEKAGRPDLVEAYTRAVGS